MHNSKHSLKKTTFHREKTKQKTDNNLCDFPLRAPRGLSAEEKQHVQEVRWDVRKAFSGSIQAGEGEWEGKGASQPARQTDWQTRREPPRAQGRRGESSGNSLCFSGVLLHFWVSPGWNVPLSTFHSRLGSVRKGERKTSGWCHQCLPRGRGWFKCLVTDGCFNFFL